MSLPTSHSLRSMSFVALLSLLLLLLLLASLQHWTWQCKRRRQWQWGRGGGRQTANGNKVSGLTLPLWSPVLGLRCRRLFSPRRRRRCHCHGHCHCQHWRRDAAATAAGFRKPVIVCAWRGVCLIVSCFWHCFNSTPFSPRLLYAPVRMSIKSHFGLHFLYFFLLLSTACVAWSKQEGESTQHGDSEGEGQVRLTLVRFQFWLLSMAIANQNAWNFVVFVVEIWHKVKFEWRALQPNKSPGSVDQIQYSVFSIQCPVFAMYICIIKLSSLIFLLSQVSYISLRSQSPPADNCLHPYHSILQDESLTK